MADDTKERKSAEAQFKKEERATEGAKAISDSRVFGTRSMIEIFDKLER